MHEYIGQIKQESPGEGKEKIAEDFSDFGESDDEILNQVSDNIYYKRCHSINLCVNSLVNGY